MASHQTGLLIIRAWVEDGSTEQLRAQIRLTNDVSTGIERTLILSDSDAVGELIDRWLQHVLDDVMDPTEVAGDS